MVMVSSAMAMESLVMVMGLILAMVVVAATSRSRSGGKKKKVPPGPRPWPVIGNLFAIGKHPHQDFARLAEQYGSVMSLWFGSVRVAVVSDARMAKELFALSDGSFASRPVHDLLRTAAKNLNFGGADGTASMFICSYGPRVREARQLCIGEVFAPQRLVLSKGTRMEEVRRMVAAVREMAGGNSQPIEMRPVICEFGLRNSCRTFFNKAFLHSERLQSSDIGLHPDTFRDWEVMNSKVWAEYNIADIVPIFRLVFGKLDVQGLNAKWKQVNALKLSWTTAVIEWYRKRQADQSSGGAAVPVDQLDSATDFTETLLRLGEDGKYTENEIKSFLSDMLAGGSDTIASTLEWVLLEIARHPHIMRRLQEEIDAKFGKLRPVDEEEAAQLPYLQAVVKEALRLRLPGVLGLPHCNMEDATLGDYHIPAGTTVFANLWAIHRDPTTWGVDALEFNPDRFLNANFNVNGTDYQYLPFGAGRKMCPGRALAMRALYGAVGSFVHAFECGGDELSPKEGTDGVNVRPETPLTLRITLRPAASVY